MTVTQRKNTCTRSERPSKVRTGDRFHQTTPGRFTADETARRRRRLLRSGCLTDVSRQQAAPELEANAFLSTFLLLLPISRAGETRWLCSSAAAPHSWAHLQRAGGSLSLPCAVAPTCCPPALQLPNYCATAFAAAAAEL